MKRLLNITFCILIFISVLSAGPDLIIRCDDIGMNHSVNLAAEKLLDSGLPVNCSVMFTCSWYPEAVKILKKYGHVSVGIHLVLNSEWREYRWGPAAGWKTVPSLVDSNGFFFPRRDLFEKNGPKLDEVEIELRAQIERAMNSGLDIAYMDYHMGTAASTPEYRKLLLRLAKEYNLGISRFYGEEDMPNVYSVDIAHKTDSLAAFIQKLPDDGTTHLLVCHIGRTLPDLNALTDLNPWGPPYMSSHRQAELDALLSGEFRRSLSERNVQIVTYGELLESRGPQALQDPWK